jgi:hypothetical protein
VVALRGRRGDEEDENVEEDKVIFTYFERVWN